MKQLWQLFCAFARVGVMTFGGGYAMIPILEREIVDRHGWATNEELMDYYAVGQCTPGVIAVNVATFIGYKEAGVLGGGFGFRGGALRSGRWASSLGTLLGPEQGLGSLGVVTLTGQCSFSPGLL